jgi:hypothetical protein
LLRDGLKQKRNTASLNLSGIDAYPPMLFIRPENKNVLLQPASHNPQRPFFYFLRLCRHGLTSRPPTNLKSAAPPQKRRRQRREDDNRDVLEHSELGVTEKNLSVMNGEQCRAVGQPVCLAPPAKRAGSRTSGSVR